MRKYFFLSALILGLLFVFQGLSRAVMITASPSPAVVDQPVTITVNSSYNTGPTGANPQCTLGVDFGDGAVELLPICLTDPCVHTVVHTYTTPGQYTITAGSKIGGTCQISPIVPDPGTVNLKVGCTGLVLSSSATLLPGASGTSYSYVFQATGGQAPYTWSVTGGALPPGLILSSAGQLTGTPTTSGAYNFTVGVSDSCPIGTQMVQKRFGLSVGCPSVNITSAAVLPAGKGGLAYSRQIQFTGGQPPVSFSVVGGALPPGLILSTSGLLAGIPTMAGTYNFTISLTDSCAIGAQQVQQAFTLGISGDLQVTVSPAVLYIPRNMGSTRTLAYSFSDNAAGTNTLISPRGVFTIGAQVIGEALTPLTVSLGNGRGLLSETLDIPVAVSLRAEEIGTSRIFYSRTFTGGAVPVTAQVELIVGTEATAGFSINRLQLYFENRRAEITVKRNQPGLKAFADIRLAGNGLLTGYWEVDGRILDYVNRHLVYGTPVTISTPDVPPLPTFSPGTHIVRFVVTSPSSDIPIPQALYFVTAEAFGEIRPIDLDFPKDRSRVPYESVDFIWQPVKWAQTYLIVFSSSNDEKPVFSAYTRENTYRLPAMILISLFQRDENYRWRVKGYNADGNVLGESDIYQVVFSE